MAEQDRGTQLVSKAAKGTGKLGMFATKKLVAYVGIPTIAVIILLLFFIVIAASEVEQLSVAFSSESETEVEESGERGKASYVGVDDTDTAFSKDILSVTRRWSNSYNPYYNGYHGLCELWCADVYRKAGHSYAGSCCAANHARKYAKKSGKIPKGALVFSGMRPNGSLYENGHRPSAYCGHSSEYAGHVAIYIGNGLIAGSQTPYIMSVDAWIELFGYGGWSMR